MLAAYRPLLRVPGARRFLAGSALARCGGAMFGMGVVGMISARTGSYALAGAVSAAGLVVLGVTAVVVGRLVDRFGQSRVTYPLLAWSTCWSLVLAVCSWRGAPAWTLYATYALSSVVATVGTMSRARWAGLLPGDSETLHTAMSLEQVIDELSYVIGPAVAVVLATAWFPEAGFLAACACYAGGALLFLSARGSEPAVAPDSHESLGLAVANPGILLLAGVMVLTGVIFGSNEVVSLAVAQEAGHTGAAGLIVALFALGSSGAGLAFGVVTPRRGLASALVIGTAGMCVMEAPILLTHSLGAIATVMFVAGMATAPTLIIVMQLSQRMVPAQQANEAMSIVITGLLIGIAAGSAVSGRVVEQVAPHAGFRVPVVAAAGAVLLALIGRPLMTRRATPAPLAATK